MHKQYISTISVTICGEDSGLRTDSLLRKGLFNIKLDLEILHQEYIAKQY